ncbi:MAG: PP2C family serine/threonine-protein phosphatase [bacterium]
MRIWKPTGVTIQSAQHIREELPCEDVISSYVKNGISVIALADGAGGKQYALDGASIVAPAVCKFIANNFTKLYTDESLNARKTILDDLMTRIAKRAKKYKCDIDDLASTLLFVAIKEDKQCIYGHIGSGSICVEDANGWSVLSNGSKANELATSANVFAIMKLEKLEIDTITSFVLMSDGCDHAFISNNTINSADVASMSEIIKTNDNDTSLDAMRNTLEAKVVGESHEDCGMIYLTKKQIVGKYESLDYEEKQTIFEKHYSHLYNVEAAIEDASFIIKVLKTTNANVQYLSKKSKVKLSNCKKIAEILTKANYLEVNEEVFSLIKIED